MGDDYSDDEDEEEDDHEQIELKDIDITFETIHANQFPTPSAIDPDNALDAIQNATDLQSRDTEKLEAAEVPEVPDLYDPQTPPRDVTESLSFKPSKFVEYFTSMKSVFDKLTGDFCKGTVKCN